MMTFKVAAVAALFGSAAAFAQTPTTQPPDPMDPSVQQQQQRSQTQSATEMPEFRTLDINGDGQLSKEEARAHSKLSEKFDDLDADNNGTLSASEYNKARQQSREQREQRQPSRDRDTQRPEM